MPAEEAEDTVAIVEVAGPVDEADEKVDDEDTFDPAPAAVVVVVASTLLDVLTKVPAEEVELMDPVTPERVADAVVDEAIVDKVVVVVVDPGVVVVVGMGMKKVLSIARKNPSTTSVAMDPLRISSLEEEERRVEEGREREQGRDEREKKQQETSHEKKERNK